MSRLLLPGERETRLGIERVGVRMGVYLPLSVGFALGFLTCLAVIGLG